MLHCHWPGLDCLELAGPLLWSTPHTPAPSRLQPEMSRRGERMGTSGQSAREAWQGPGHQRLRLAATGENIKRGEEAALRLGCCPPGGCAREKPRQRAWGSDPRGHRADKAAVGVPLLPEKQGANPSQHRLKPEGKSGVHTFQSGP